MAAASWLRIAVVQFAPELGRVHANIAKARELCRGLTPRSVDLVCLPEMIFSGYMFPDAPSIKPYLEHPKTGPTASFCAELARHLECHVLAGFPERVEDTQPSATVSESDHSLASTTPSNAHPLIGTNAAVLYDSTGRLLHTYHKSNLFPTDLTWARSGPGFTAVDLPEPFGRTAVAICNDMNVQIGEAWASIEGGPYELAEFCRREGVRVLVSLNAWLRPEDGGMEDIEGDDDGGRVAGASADGSGEHDGGDGLEPNWSVLNYWAMRLRPLWVNPREIDGQRDAHQSARQAGHANDKQEVIVIVCNRFGYERGKTFAGSSAMFSMRRGSGKPQLLHVMGEREEGVRVWTTRIESS